MGEAWQDYNKTEAFESLNKFREANVTIDLDNYSAIQQMTNVTDPENASQVATSIFTPINSFWASDALYGSWFYVILIIITVGCVYVKSQSLHRTSITMLFMGLLAVSPEVAGVLYIPASALYALYTLTGLGLMGVLYSFWVGE